MQKQLFKKSEVSGPVTSAHTQGCATEQLEANELTQAACHLACGPVLAPRHHRRLRHPLQFSQALHHHRHPRSAAHLTGRRDASATAP